MSLDGSSDHSFQFLTIFLFLCFFNFLFYFIVAFICREEWRVTSKVRANVVGSSTVDENPIFLIRV